MAMMAHTKNLGMLIGDGTGVGKGRILAGIMLNHKSFNPECKKYMILTASAQLAADFERDLKSIGWKLDGKNGLPIRNLSDTKQGWKVDEKIKLTQGVLFVTYATLRTGFGEPKRKRSRSRLSQIVEWANSGPEPFSGVVAFDEVHCSKNFHNATSQAVVQLQERLTDASVVYASATAMSSVGHLLSLTRLGLWGPGTAYETHRQFEEKWKNQTRSGLEVVVAELAARGLYIARSLSFEGTEFKTSYADLTPEQAALHKRLCTWWTSLARMGVLTGQQNRKRFWGAHLRFFKALFVANRVDHCVELARAEIAKGGSIVVSLIGTGASVAKRVLEEHGEESLEDDGFIALQEIMKSIVTHAIDSIEKKSETPPVQLLQLREEVDGFSLPPSPLDYLIHKLSEIKAPDGKCERVIEMTGRKGGFYCEGGRWMWKDRKLSNVEGCKVFQSGEARIAVISAAASTGISLQNETRYPNRHRTQFMIELPWAADQAVQAMGRTNRADQHDAPTYVIIVSNADAENRFIAPLAKRVADLGAATTGDRRGAGGDRAFGSDLLVGSHAKDAIQKLWACRAMSTWPKWGPCSRDEDTSEPTEDWQSFIQPIAQTLDVLGITFESEPTQLLGRLLGVELQASNNCMRLYEAACMEAMLNSEANKADRTDLGVEDVFLGQRSNVFHTSIGGLMQIDTDIGVSMDDALKKGRKDEQEFGTRFMFAMRKDKNTDRYFNVLAQEAKAHMRITRPNGRVSAMTKADFHIMYTKIPEPEDGTTEYQLARRYWEAEYAYSLDTCSHGKGCKFGSECTVGKRCVRTCLLPMPALNALCTYVGPRQIIRLTDETEGQHPRRCVAVRISNSRHTIEEHLLAEINRNKTTTAGAAEAKAALMAKLQAQTASTAPLPEVAGPSDDSSDEDEDEDEEHGPAPRQSRTFDSDSDDESDDDRCGPDEEVPKRARRVAVNSDDDDMNVATEESVEDVSDDSSDDDDDGEYDPEEDDSDDSEV